MSASASIRPVSPFAVATIAPIPLLLLGGLFGGIFIWAALLYMTVFVMVLDGIFRTAGGEAAPGTEWPMAEKLSQGLAMAHFPLLILGILAVKGQTVSGWSGFAALLAFGMYFGQVSNSNAHELIHRTDKTSFNLGKWVLISLLYGHHVSAHRLIHHRFVGTPQDPNSARAGEGFWSFFPRAWGDAFAAGYEMEINMARDAGKELPIWKNPYAQYVGGAVAILLFVLIAFGFSGLLAYLLLAVYAQIQLLLSDYVQHYGLHRRQLEDGEYEPVAPWHSWNSTHWFSGGLMLNAPRHSDHHMNPARPYPELALPDHMEGPRLPYSLPVMAAIALVPPAWFNVMNRRVMVWQERIDEGSIPLNRMLPPTPASETLASPAVPKTQAQSDDITSRVSAAMTEEEKPAAVEEVIAQPDQPRRQPRGAVALAAGLDGAVRSQRPSQPPEKVEPKEGSADDEQAVVEAKDRDSDRPSEDLSEESIPHTLDYDEDDAVLSGGERSSVLWNDPEALFEPEPEVQEPEPEEEPVPEISEEERLASALRAAGVEPTEEALAEAAGLSADDDLDDEDETEFDIDGAIAGVMANVRKEERRKRAKKFPTLEPADADHEEQAQVKHSGGVGFAVRGLGKAARGVAALLRGAPAQTRPAKPVEWEAEE